MRRLFGPVFIAAGIYHFVNPKVYEAIMPDYLPAHRELVYASGVAEAASGAMLMHPATRKAGFWLSVATLVGVFPANLHMALHPERYKKIPRAALYGRLPIQALFVLWAWAASKDD
jgi:uncharacterized membrane protein